jgi:hypothetical protein
LRIDPLRFAAERRRVVTVGSKPLILWKAPWGDVRHTRVAQCKIAFWQHLAEENNAGP